MSKFVDNLTRLCRAAPQPIGFLNRQPAPPSSRMQLLAIVAPEDLDHVSDFVEGADGVLLPIASQNPSRKRLNGFTDVVGDVPWGGWLKSGHAGLPDLVKAGCDFIVFATSAALSIAADNKLGKILEVDASVANSLLRTVNNLPADAVFINDDSVKEGLTWQHILLVQRLDSLVTKPILAPVPSGVSSEELKAWWEAGVDCAVVDTEGTSPETFRAVHKAIADTNFPPRGRREKIDTVLPRIGREPVPVSPEEEEEE